MEPKDLKEEPLGSFPNVFHEIHLNTFVTRFHAGEIGKWKTSAQNFILLFEKFVRMN